MRIMVASDIAPISAAVQNVLHNNGCPADGLVGVFPLREAEERAVQHRPDAILLFLSPDPEQCLAVLRDMTDTFPCRVICIGPGSDAKLILRTLHEGAYIYINDEQIEAELKTALSKLRLEAPLPVRHGRVITVLGTAGGSGASTVAVNVAALLARKYGECGLVDLNLEGGDLATLLGVEPVHTVADFCRNASRMDPTMFQQCLVPHASGVRLLAPPGEYEDIAHVTPRGVRKALSMARTLFQFVVIDLHHAAHPAHAQALFQSDIILLVLRLDFTSLRQTGRILQHLDRLGISRDSVQLVANRCYQRRELPAAELEKALGMKIGHFIPDDSSSMNLASNKGIPIVLESPRSKPSRCLVKLAVSVNGLAPA